MNYPPYITERAREIRAVESLTDRYTQARDAVRARRRQLTEYRREYKALHGIRLDSGRQEHDDQELTELLDLRNRAHRESLDNLGVTK